MVSLFSRNVHTMGGRSNDVGLDHSGKVLEDKAEGCKAGDHVVLILAGHQRT